MKLSKRLFFRGQDHSAIYYQGHYHNKIYRESSLLWEKRDDLLKYAVRFILTPWNCVHDEDFWGRPMTPITHQLDELGFRLQINEQARVAKCGVYVTDRYPPPMNLHTYFQYTMAFRGTEVVGTPRTCTYTAYQGNIYHDGWYDRNLFYGSALTIDADGIYSPGGQYNLLGDAHAYSISIQSGRHIYSNTRLFYDLDAMKTWLLEEAEE